MMSMINHYHCSLCSQVILQRLSLDLHRVKKLGRRLKEKCEDNESLSKQQLTTLHLL